MNGDCQYRLRQVDLDTANAPRWRGQDQRCRSLFLGSLSLPADTADRFNGEAIEQRYRNRIRYTQAV